MPKEKKGYLSLIEENKTFFGRNKTKKTLKQLFSL